MSMKLGISLLMNEEQNNDQHMNNPGRIEKDLVHLEKIVIRMNSG